MRPSRAFTILAALALVTSLVPGATAQLTNEYQVENVRHEPGGPVDQGTHESYPGNGFDDTTEGEWDLVLHSYVTNDVVALAEVNRLMNEVVREFTGSSTDERYIIPGVSTVDAFWGWLNDHASGGYHNEDPFVSTQDSGDGVIDDGDDNHDEDVAYGDCPATNPTCWQSTGPWDEFIWRGPNDLVGQGNHSYATEPGSENIHNTSDDELYTFISPGTHASWFETAWGNEGDRTPEPAPGYGVISEGRDDAQHPEWQLQWFGQSWLGEIFFPSDASLTMTTEVITAANPDDAVERGLLEVQASTAADRDVYSAINPAVETAYRMTVWDPADNGERDDVECDSGSCQEGNLFAAVHEEGPKERVKEVYSVDYANINAQLNDMLANLTRPAEPVQGFAADHSNGAPYKHEPNHPDDSYPGAVYNDGAEYESLSDPYYTNVTQDWSGYADNEQLFADWENRFNTYGVVVQGAFSYNWGVNAEQIGNPGSQDTQGPYMMSHFGWVGTWWDAERTDTWVGDITDPGCSSPDYPYCNGTAQNPNNYNHNPEGFPPWADTPEWRGTCNADVTFTIEPLGTPKRDNDGDGELEPAWGTTVPPAGVYQYPIFSEGALIGEALEGNGTARYHQWGVLEIPVGCDEDDAASGQWFPGDGLVLPTGTATYPIKTTATVNLTGEEGSRKDRVTGDDLVDDPEQVVVDVDLINAWQSSTHTHTPPTTNEYS